MRIYTQNQIEVIESSLDEPMVIYIKYLMEEKESWTGTANQLLADLEMLPQMSDKLKKSKQWPQNPKALHSQLKRHAPFLRQIGINYKKWRDSDKRGIEIEKIAVDKPKPVKIENKNPN
jgi:hypothetical protein